MVIDETKVQLQLNDDPSVPFDGEELYAIGLGYSDNDYNCPLRLQEITTSAMSNDDCRTIDSIYSAITDDMLCAGGVPGGQDICSGDSGGPIIRRTEKEDGTFVDTHVGLTSWGRNDGQPCGYTTAGASVYARTSTNLDWITEAACNLGSQASWCSNPPPGSCDGPKLTFQLNLPAGLTFNFYSGDPKLVWSLRNMDTNRRIINSRLKRAIADNLYVYEHTVCLEFDTEYKWKIEEDEKFKLSTPLEYTLSVDDTLLVSGSEYETTTFSVPSCGINPNPFYTESGKERTCSEVAALETGRKKMCKKSPFAKNCSGLCNKEECPCVDYPDSFPWKDRSLSCGEVAGWSMTKQKRKCRSNIIRNNCPGVCDTQCTESL